jgi:hypothetical protein
MTLKVLHVITHLAVGGATKNLLALCRLSDRAHFAPAVLCGTTPSVEPPGGLFCVLGYGTLAARAPHGCYPHAWF